MDKQQIESILKNAPTPQPSAQLQDKLLADLKRQAIGDGPIPIHVQPRPSHRPGLWRYAAAAIFAIGLLGGMLIMEGLNNGSVAWAEVTSQARAISQIHIYAFEFRGGELKANRESWYVAGKVIDVLADGRHGVDDGVSRTIYNRDGAVEEKRPSFLRGLAQAGRQQDPFKMLAQGVFAYNDEEIGRQKPADIGEDFLVYRFGAPGNFDQSIEKVAITVGRHSLLPVQMKIFFKGEQNATDLYVFDYEQKQIPAAVAKLSGQPVSPVGAWEGRWKSQSGDEGQFAAIITHDGVEYRMQIKESLAEGAPEVWVVRKLSILNDSLDMEADGRGWSGTVLGAITADKITGRFDGTETGEFTLARVQ